MNAVKATALMAIAKTAYQAVLRPLLVDFTEKTDNDYDNYLVDIFDRIFLYNG